MKPHRALLLLIGSCVLSLVGWTSNADAVPTLTITDELNHTAMLGFTSVASGTFGCVSGYTCFKMTDFLTTGGTPATRTLSYVTTSGTPVASSAVGVPANTWLQITTGGNFTSGPIVGELSNGVTTAALVMNGGIFQGFSSTTGTLTLTLSEGFNLTGSAVSIPLAEQGAFLQTSGSFTGDNLTYQGLLNGTAWGQISASGSGSGTTSGISISLSPAASPINTRTDAGLDVLAMKLVYNYNNTNGPGSKYSDPGNACNQDVPPIQNPNCGAPGGVGIGAVDVTDPTAQTFLSGFSTTVCGVNGCTTQVPNEIPEPSTLLLLGFGLLGGGLFFAARSRTQRQLP